MDITIGNVLINYESNVILLSLLRNRVYFDFDESQTNDWLYTIHQLSNQQAGHIHNIVT